MHRLSFASRRRIERLLLWLFVIDLAVAFGAGLYEARVALPMWLVELPSGARVWRPEVARDMDSGLRFWAFVTTGPLTLLTIANLLAARKAAGRLRAFWLGTSLVALVERAFTFGYFIPTMVTLMEARMPQADAVLLAEQWQSLNLLRHALLAAALLGALRAFGLHHAEHGAASPARERG